MRRSTTTPSVFGGWVSVDLHVWAGGFHGFDPDGAAPAVQNRSEFPADPTDLATPTTAEPVPGGRKFGIELGTAVEPHSGCR